MSRSRKRAARQAELGEVEESAAATYERDPEAADEVAAELCDAIRDVVAYVCAAALHSVEVVLVFSWFSYYHGCAGSGS
jgi:methylaspartate ammonia-lyase